MTTFSPRTQFRTFLLVFVCICPSSYASSPTGNEAHDTTLVSSLSETKVASGYAYVTTLSDDPKVYNCRNAEQNEDPNYVTDDSMDCRRDISQCNEVGHDIETYAHFCKQENALKETKKETKDYLLARLCCYRIVQMTCPCLSTNRKEVRSSQNSFDHYFAAKINDKDHRVLFKIDNEKKTLLPRIDTSLLYDISKQYEASKKEMATKKTFFGETQKHYCYIATAAASGRSDSSDRLCINDLQYLWHKMGKQPENNYVHQSNLNRWIRRRDEELGGELTLTKDQQIAYPSGHRKKNKDREGHEAPPPTADSLQQLVATFNMLRREIKATPKDLTERDRSIIVSKFSKVAARPPPKKTDA